MTYADNWVVSKYQRFKGLRGFLKISLAVLRTAKNFFVMLSVSLRKNTARTLCASVESPGSIRCTKFSRVVKSVEDCELDEQSCSVIPRDTAAAADKSGP